MSLQAMSIISKKKPAEKAEKKSGLTVSDLAKMSSSYLKLWMAAEAIDPVNKGRFLEGEDNYTPFYSDGNIRFGATVTAVSSVLPHFRNSLDCAHFIVCNQEDLMVVFALPNFKDEYIPGLKVS